MSNPNFTIIAATIITVLFVTGIIGITGTILIVMIYKVVTHPSDISVAGYILIALVLYSAWLCYKILHWRNMKIKKKEKLKPVDGSPLLFDRFSRFMSYFWVWLILFLLNGIIASCIVLSANWITTLSTADCYEAEITGMKVGESEGSNRSRRRQSTGFSITSHSAKKTFTPVVRFQSKEGLILERDLYFISGKTLEIGSKLPVYYSPLTDQAIYKSTFTYGMIAVVTLISFFLLMLTLVLFSYGLLGKVPNRILAFWDQVKLRLFYIVMFMGLVGMTCFLGNLIFEWLSGKSENQLPGIAILFCSVLFVGCLLGGIGMLCYLCGRKPASLHQNRKKKKKRSK